MLWYLCWLNGDNINGLGSLFNFYQAYFYDIGFWNNLYWLIYNLISENKLFISAIGNSHNQISREKFKPQPKFDLEVQGSNSGRFRYKFSPLSLII